jgi:hypothetical protein
MHKLYEFIGVQGFPMTEQAQGDVNEKYFSMWEREITESPMAMRWMRLLCALPDHFGYHFQPPYVRESSIKRTDGHSSISPGV